MPLRRQLFAFVTVAVVCAVLGEARAADPIERLAGVVDARTYPKLVDAVSRSLDKVVLLDVRVAADDTTLIASTDGHGTAIFVPKGDTEIYVPQNAGVRQNPLRIEGFYTVRNGGMNQGIVAYALEAAPGVKPPAESAGLKTIELK